MNEIYILLSVILSLCKIIKKDAYLIQISKGQRFFVLFDSIYAVLMDTKYINKQYINNV